MNIDIIIVLIVVLIGAIGYLLLKKYTKDDTSTYPPLNFPNPPNDSIVLKETKNCELLRNPFINEPKCESDNKKTYDYIIVKKNNNIGIECSQISTFINPNYKDWAINKKNDTEYLSGSIGCKYIQLEDGYLRFGSSNESKKIVNIYESFLGDDNDNKKIKIYFNNNSNGQIIEGLDIPKDFKLPNGNNLEDLFNTQKYTMGLTNTDRILIEVESGHRLEISNYFSSPNYISELSKNYLALVLLYVPESVDTFRRYDDVIYFTRIE
jgi:hypothetical protein